MNTSFVEGPKGVDGENGRGVFGPYGTETRSTEDTAVGQVLPKAKFHHQVGVAVQRG